MNGYKQIYPLIAAMLVLGGGYWAILQAEDRWNQKQDISKIYTVMQQLQEDIEILLLEGRLKTLNDEMFYLKLNIKRFPEVQEYKERYKVLDAEIYRTNRQIERMRRSKREIEND